MERNLHYAPNGDYCKASETLNSDNISATNINLNELGERLNVAQDHFHELIDKIDLWKAKYKDRQQLTSFIRTASNKDKEAVVVDLKDTHRKSSNSENEINQAADGICDTTPKGRTSLVSQNSSNINTDHSGGAVMTINKILNGITNSVNKIAMHAQIKSPSKNKREETESQVVLPTKASKRKQTPQSSAVILNNSSIISIKAKNLKRNQPRPSVVGKSHSRPITAKVQEKPPKVSPESTGKITKKRPMRRLKSKNTNKKNISSKSSQKFSTHKLVEIYHNKAVANSDSDEVVHRSDGGKTAKINQVPPLKIGSEVTKTDLLEVHRVQKTERPHVETAIARRQSICDDQQHRLHSHRALSYYSRNYQMPTISSQMKKANRYYFDTFNFKAIPFCPASSTSPSHNIGINIQQFMNILKTKQPMHGISPTLAHNIGLAAERLNGKPFASIASAMASRIGSRCPLSKASINYSQYQEMAKIIPNDVIQEENEETSKSSSVQTVLITGPSGDMEVKHPKVMMWTSDGGPPQICTCIPQEGLKISQIVRKYNSNMHGTNCNCCKSRMMTKTTTRKSFVNKPHAIMVKTKTTGSSSPRNVYNNNSNDSNALYGNEKNLKDVLTNLHNEFEHLNNRYEELSKLHENAKDNEEILKELEILEKNLNSKEEEITMVMNLYKEVLALKQQIKCLKKRTSHGSITSTTTTAKVAEYNTPQAAFHLTKLLRQIKHYHTHYKHDVNFK